MRTSKRKKHEKTQNRNMRNEQEKSSGSKTESRGQNKKTNLKTWPFPTILF